MSQASTRSLGLSVPVSEALDPVLWRRRYANGIVLGAMRRLSLRERMELGDEKKVEALAEELPDDVIRWHLRAALSEMELKLGIPMGIEVCKGDPVGSDLVEGVHYDKVVPRLPYTRGESLRFFRIDLPPSVISVERIRGFYFGQLVWDLSDDMSRVRLEWPKPGVLHIMPLNLQGMLVTQSEINSGGGNYGIWQTINLHTSPLPDFWCLDYTVGPRSRDGQVGHIPAVLANWVYCTAGQILLAQGGLAQSRGVTSTSVSMDGVSRSVGLSAGGIYGLNAAVGLAYDEAVKRIDWKQLRANMRGLRIFMYSY